MVSEIEESGYLSALRRSGGINFLACKSGGYRPKANTIITIDLQQLTAAIENGFIFFHNRFSGLVFGIGKKDNDGLWDGKIPLSTSQFCLYDE